MHQPASFINSADDVSWVQLVPSDVFYLNSMCEEATFMPPSPVAPATTPIPIIPAGYGRPQGYGYGSPPASTAAAPGPSMGMASELAPETAPMGMGAPAKPQIKVSNQCSRLTLHSLTTTCFPLLFRTCLQRLLTNDQAWSTSHQCIPHKLQMCGIYHASCKTKMPT